MAYTNIDDPSAHFQAFIYTGTGTNNSITLDGNSDLQPDLYWYKTRSNSNYHYLTDSSRGTTNYIYPNDSLAEGTGYTSYVQSFDTNGVTLGAGDSGTNTNGTTFANWVWKANGGTTSSNTDGTITSTVQANQDAGFSIVTWTGNENASATVGHGLGVAPDMWIGKRRNGTYNWQVYTSALAPVGGNNLILGLNTDAAAEQVSGTSFTSSSTFQPGSNAKRNSGNMIAYCFASKQGYSKFGKYVGNGESLNGPFVYTGFKPAFVMIKNTNTSGRNWYIYDTKRRAFNSNGTIISANTTSAEAIDQAIDILSNGFKVKPGDLGSFGTSNINHSGQKMIYMAFAENPFVTSTGVPTTAR